MARTKKIARKSTGGQAPRKQLAKKVVSKAELASRQAIDPNEEEGNAGSGEEEQEEEEQQEEEKEEEEEPAQKKRKVETAAGEEEDQLASDAVQPEEEIVAKENEGVMETEGVTESEPQGKDDTPQATFAQPEVEGGKAVEEEKSVDASKNEVVAESKE